MHTDPASTVSNIAAALPVMAARQPDAVAIRCPGQQDAQGRHRYDVELSYRDLEQRSNAVAAALTRAGIERGTRTALMVRPSPELFLLMFPVQAGSGTGTDRSGHRPARPAPVPG